jgi:hypothetical protein
MRKHLRCGGAILKLASPILYPKSDNESIKYITSYVAQSLKRWTPFAV